MSDYNFNYLKDLFEKSKNISLFESIINNDRVKNILLIDEEIKVDGNGNILDAQNSSNIFEIENCKIVFKNICFKNGNFYSGGALSIKSSEIEFINCSFLNNSSNGYGGAISAVDSSILIKDCEFKSNRSFDYGGAISSQDGTLKICNSKFIYNKSSIGGGAIYNLNGKMDMENCSFEYNHAPINGEAIINQNIDYYDIYAEIKLNTNYSVANINNCVFKSNDFKNYDDLIFNDNASLDLKNCKILYNNPSEK